uniref:CX domain-containing protein n=1 Tax=Panagrellus redivivus TaxID=6233 RepID=A0A7E4VRF7_PANRE
MTYKGLSLIVLVLPVVFGYCPQCERNAQFMNLMNQLRPNGGIGGNVGANGGANGNGAANVGPFGASYGVNGNGNGNSNTYGQWNSNSNGVGNGVGVGVNSLNVETPNSGISQGYSGQPQTFNGQIGNLPIRIINTGGYGCCANSYGPCCNNNGNGFKVINLNALTNAQSNINPSPNSHYARAEPQNNENPQPEWLQAHTEIIPASESASAPMTFEQYQTAQLQQQLHQQAASQVYNTPGAIPAYRIVDNGNTQQIVVQSW